jgi:hypothetical protein
MHQVDALFFCPYTSAVLRHVGPGPVMRRESLCLMTFFSCLVNVWKKAEQERGEGI